MKKSNLILVCIMAVCFFGMSFWTWGKGADSYSESERRVLAAFPKLTKEKVLSGKFMTEFEDYTLDQFPMRDRFRSIKAMAQTAVFKQKANNGLYLADGYLAKQEYPMNEYMLEHAAEKFRYLYDTYMADTDVKIYFSIVPDKNYFLAKEHGYLSMDYEKLVERMRQKTSYMQYIDIMDKLEVSDYYRLDTHWRQEAITDVAAHIAESMGNTLHWQYEECVSEQPFYGVYYGQSALPLAPDSLTYLVNEELESCTVTSYDTGIPKEKSVYDLEALYGRDPYEMFLGGSDALLIIENPNATTDKELVVFRDSFGSSLIPLLVESYQKVTVIDIRYVKSSALASFVQFEQQDVLFLYSTLVLNTSTSFK